MDGGDITKYCEPMVGGGALLFDMIAKYDFKELYISDINAELINAYKVIKTDVEALIARLEEMQMLFLPMDENGRKLYYYTIRSKFNSVELSDVTSVEKPHILYSSIRRALTGFTGSIKKGNSTCLWEHTKTRLFATRIICVT